MNGSAQPEQTKELTFGEKAVALNFNPSNDPDAQELKVLYSKIIDKLEEIKVKKNTPTPDYLSNTISGEALRKAMDAQMWAVKYATYNP